MASASGLDFSGDLDHYTDTGSFAIVALEQFNKFC